MIEQLNSLAQIWWNWMWPMFWQVGALVAFVSSIDLLLRRYIWPQIRYALWLLILVKLMIPPTFSLSTSIVSRVRMPVNQATAEPSAADLPANYSSPESGLNAAGIEMAPSAALEHKPAYETGRPPEEVLSGHPRGATLGWKAYLMTVWLTGVGALGWWVAVRLRRLRRLYGGRTDQADLPGWFEPLLAETADKLRLRRLPEIALSVDIASPAVFGTLGPVLVLPEATVSDLSHKRAEHILLHELAHIKRGDLIVNTIYTLLQIVYWFNPLLWLCRRQLQHLRELCCDATVARILRERTPEYRETILETARRLLVKPVEPGIGLLGLFENSSRLRIRLHWLEKKTWKHRRLRIATIIVVVTVVSVCVLPMAGANKDDGTSASQAGQAMDAETENTYDKPSDTGDVRGSAAGQNPDDFLRFLEARDESISNYEIKLRQGNFEIGLDEYGAFKKSVEQLAQRRSTEVSPSQQAEQFVQKWADKVSWHERHVLQRGERFKESHAFTNGLPQIRSYDGRLHYRYSLANRQLDIHTRRPNVTRVTLRELGLTARGTSKSAELASFEQYQEGVRCVFSLSGDPHTMTREYDRNLSLGHSQLKFSDTGQMDDYYIFHENIDGYRVPRIKVNLDYYERHDKCSIRVYVIEDVKLNCELTDEDLSLGDLPDETLVMDYRFEPSEQWHYGEYRLAADNPEVVHTGRCKPEEMIEYLKKTSSGREALSTRDSRIGRKAPPLQTSEWLLNPPAADKWPPAQFTVLGFCSVGCGFCIREIPENNELAEWVKSRGGRYLSIHSATAEPSKVKDSFGSRGVRYAVALDKPDNKAAYWGSATFAAYGVNSIPKYVTISRDGRVLSYDRSLTKQKLQTLMTSDPNDIVARAKPKDIHRLAAIPTGWLAADLEPNSQVQGRFFVFRSETPDLRLRESEATNSEVEFKGIRHTAKGQTVYEVLLTAKTPNWGQTLKGQVSLVAEYGEAEELLTIPYELTSRSLVECVSPSVFFGSIEKGKPVARRMALRKTDPQGKVTITAVSPPSNFQLRIDGLGRRPGEILGECSFRSDEPGLQKGTAKFLARDREGNEQPLTIDYCAFVLP